MKLYRSYSDVGILALIQRERARRSIPNLLFAGLPTAIAYHLSEWVGCYLESVLDHMYDENEVLLTSQDVWIKNIADTW